MGEWTTFQCGSCGYESRPVRWGVGVNNPSRRFMPALCPSCNEYVEVDLTGADMVVDQFTCNLCGGEVGFVERRDAYGCPRCAGPSVRLTQGIEYW